MNSKEIAKRLVELAEHLLEAPPPFYGVDDAEDKIAKSSDPFEFNSDVSLIKTKIAAYFKVKQEDIRTTPHPGPTTNEYHVSIRTGVNVSAEDLVNLAHLLDADGVRLMGDNKLRVWWKYT